MVKYNILLIPFFLLLIGCASSMNAYQAPAGEMHSATIRGTSHSNSLFTFEQTQVQQIDSKEIGILWTQAQKIKLAPGLHTVKVVAESKPRSFANGQYVLNENHFTALPNQDYRVIMKADNNRIMTWIEDSYHKIVSDKVSSEALDIGTEEAVVPSLSR